jgi:integrase
MAQDQAAERGRAVHASRDGLRPVVDVAAVEGLARAVALCSIERHLQSALIFGRCDPQCLWCEAAGDSAAQDPAGRTRWLTSEEWARLRTCLEEESQLLRQCAEFTLATGLRENNVLELEWEQVSWATKQAWIHPDQAKAGKAIGVPLNADACRILKERVGVHKKWVFGNPDHPLTRASNRAWYAARRKAKLSGFRWHDLRHTWASWAVMSGVRLEELQRMGGWATAQMVQRYAHLSTEHLADAAARIKPISLRYNAPKRGRKDTKIPTTGA